VVNYVDTKNSNFKNLVIASNRDLEKSDLELYEILNYYKMTIYILSCLNEDFYYDENMKMHISKINKRTELMTFLRKKLT